MSTIKPKDIPKFLKNYPEPEWVDRLYHGRLLWLCKGEVSISDIRGWADNPRLNLEMKDWKNEHADASITQDYLYDLMVETEHVHLKELSKNIRENGLREPIILTFEGNLLDGNRRFFATKFAYDNSKDENEKRKLSNIPAFVLPQNALEEDIHHILVEENFSPSLKKEWPDYVKSIYIHKAKEEGKTNQDIAKTYGWTVAKVTDTIRTYEILQNFIEYAVSPPDPESGGGGLGKSELEAEKIASKNYQFFNEAQKSFRDQLRDDLDFSELFYQLIAKEKFFKSWQEVRRAYDGYQDPTAKKILEAGEASGGKDLRVLIDVKKRNLKEILSAQETIDKFIEFLSGMSTEQKQSVSGDSLMNLEKTLTTVINMIKSKP